MTEAQGKIAGSNAEHQVVFYGLSTCIWCKRTRKFLEDLGVTFDFFYLDKFEGDEREQLVEEVGRWNSAKSFPTIVIDDEKAVIGYRQEEIREALGL